MHRAAPLRRAALGLAALALAASLPACASAPAPPPRGLEELYHESLEDRGADLDPGRLRQLSARRARRLEEVRGLLGPSPAGGEAGEPATGSAEPGSGLAAVTPSIRLSAEEELWAASILLDSDDPLDLEHAAELALSAAERGLDRGFRLAAEAIDRGLLVQGYPQRYGTQYVYTPATGRWSLWIWDPATSDAERAAMGLPTLHEALARADLLNRGVR